jgi:hypothetical protein
VATAHRHVILRKPDDRLHVIACVRSAFQCATRPVLRSRAMGLRLIFPSSVFPSGVRLRLLVLSRIAGMTRRRAPCDRDDGRCRC